MGGATVVCQRAKVDFCRSFCGSPRKRSLRYKVVGCSRRGSHVHGGGVAANVISTAGAVGNDSVGNVKGATSVTDAAS